jgi:lipoyl(octanoyl) transferase
VPTPKPAVVIALTRYPTGPTRLGTVTAPAHLSTGRPSVIRAGVVDYLTAWQEQRRQHDAVVAGTSPGAVLLLEHSSVYTAGKRTEPWDRPFDGTPVIDVDRGGKITWHGPGQLVGYPILRLPEPIDVVSYVRRLERVLIDVCAAVGLAAGRVEGRSGVWVPADDRGPDRKVAAIGIRVARGVTLHGFALNCDCDLAYFDRIVPCGIRDAGVTSLSAELGRSVTVAEVLPLVEERLPVLFAGPTQDRPGISPR